MPDGWKWSTAEKTAPYWRIVKVPGVAVDKLEAFLAPEPALLGKDKDGNDIPNRMARRRAFSVNMVALLVHIAAGTTMGEALALALKVAKPPLTDPNPNVKAFLADLVIG